jgi:hypothetical protein
MQISKQSWHTRFYRFMGNDIHKRTSLCDYFWTILAQLVIVLISSGVVVFGLYSNPKLTLSWLVAIVAIPIILFLGMLAVAFIATSDFPDILRWVDTSLPVERYRAWKEKKCPLIEFVE